MNSVRHKDTASGGLCSTGGPVVFPKDSACTSSVPGATERKTKIHRIAESDDDFGAPKTPSKKKCKRGALQNDSRLSLPIKCTPCKPRTKTVVHPTPLSSEIGADKTRVWRRRRGDVGLESLQQAVDYAVQGDLSHLPKDPWST